MRTRVPLLALAAFLLCAHSACRQSADAHNLATVDSLLLVTDSLIKGMNALDMASVSRIDSIYTSKKDMVQARMRDTLSKDEALLLVNYHRTMTKSLGRARKDHDAVLMELATTRTQLSDLRNDVDKGLLEREVEVKYISDERLALAKARRDADIVASSVASVIRDEARLGSKVDPLLAPDTIPAK
jgi:hypothetical protein